MNENLENLSQNQLEASEELSTEDISAISDAEQLRALISETKDQLDRAKKETRQVNESLELAQVDDSLHRLLTIAGCIKPQEASLILKGRNTFELNDKGKLVSKESGSTVTPELLIGRLKSEFPQIFSSSRRPKANGLRNNSRYDMWRSELGSIR